MEYVVGGDAKSLISKSRLKNETVKLLIAEIAIAIDYIHENNIFHKDIKPENILITSNVSLK